MTPKGQKVPLTERALVQRINRKLAHEGEVLKKCRCAVCGNRIDGSAHCNLGPYFIVDLSTNAVTNKEMDDLESLGNELKVIQPWEKLEA